MSGLLETLRQHPELATRPAPPPPSDGSPILSTAETTLWRPVVAGALTAGTLAGGLWLARRPLARQKIVDVAATYGLPPDLAMTWKRPHAAGQALEAAERTEVDLARLTKQLTHLPWYQLWRTMPPERIKQVHDAALEQWISLHGHTNVRLAIVYRYLEQRARRIRNTPLAEQYASLAQHHQELHEQAKATALSHTPPWFQDATFYMNRIFEGAQRARDSLGMSRFPTFPGPYLPRRALDEGPLDITSLHPQGRGPGGRLRTSLGTGKRRFMTFSEGEAKGYVYEDPRITYLNHWLTLERVQATDRAVQALRGRVIFETEKAAAEVSPTGTAFPVEGIPGQRRWWAPTREEARFLKANFSDPARGPISFLTQWANWAFRNPNLMNPLPHFLKNMLYKFGMVAGPVSGTKHLRDLAEYWNTTGAGGLYAVAHRIVPKNPELVNRFRRVMPFSETGRLAEDVIAREIYGFKYQNAPTITKAAANAWLAFTGLNHWSSRQIFSRMDPALRYALWKKYVMEGLSDQAAAAHTHIDLVRYGTRGDIVDIWKSIPMNFFVPWRLGTVTTTFKQLATHPIRTALVIGVIDYLRESRYRKTGRWTHLPIDYVEGPVASMLMARDTREGMTALIVATLGTLALGPGGGHGATQLAQLLQGIGGNPAEWHRLKNMFWGIAQLWDIPMHALPKLANGIESGDPAQMARAFTDLLTTVLIAEHNALNYQPKRLGAFLPEWLPGMEKAPEVRAAEIMQEDIRRRHEQASIRRSWRREHGSIEKIIERTYGR